MKNVPTNLSNLISKVDKLYFNILVPVPVDLSKLSDVVKNDAIKKDVYHAKIKNIEDKIPDITNLATNTTLNAKINEVKNKVSSITNLATNVSLNAKINEVKNEIPRNNLATTTALTALENKIPDHRKYITTPEFNKLTAQNIAANWKLANFATKSDIAHFIKKTGFDSKLKNLNKKVISNKLQHVLDENELRELQDKIDNYKHMIQVFLSIKATFLIMEHYFT